MTELITFIQSFFKPKKSKSILDMPSRDKKKLIHEAVRESNKMQKALIDQYAKKHPGKQFYL